MLSLVRVRRVALFIGVTLPIAETLRRSGDLGSWWLWIDDYLIGGSLIAGAWLSRTGSARGIRALAAAWGLSCGMGYYSFVGHLLRVHETDVSGFAGATITSVIGVGLAICIWCLVSTVAASPRE